MVIIVKGLSPFTYRFAFIIIEYCEVNNLMSRETFWIQKLKSSYNILQYGYSSIGYKHTAESKETLSKLATGRKHKEETKLKISAAVKADKNPFYNKMHTIETKLKISYNKSKGVVYLYNSSKGLPQSSGHDTLYRGPLLFIFSSAKEVIKSIGKVPMGLFRLKLIL